jgi:hypothetical protein
MTAFHKIWLLVPTVVMALVMFATWGAPWAFSGSILGGYLLASLSSGIGLKIWSEMHPPNDRVPGYIWLMGFIWPVMFATAIYDLVVVRRQESSSLRGEPSSR